MKLIVGLGNPGKKYERTRHNVGFLAVDWLAGEMRWQESARARALYTKIDLNGMAVELLKPTTYMNESGVAVAYVAKKHGLKSADIIVVHDDKDIPLGEIRAQPGRGAAGHHGVLSIIERLGTKDFWRVRVGIAPAAGVRGDTAEFVLAKFTKEEQGILLQAIERAGEEIKRILSS
ncbi:MAG: aminoacyl-tRNA hydrolase [Candidatus Magasanikbacteria bacterium]|nr:aminoacyl-tRNA hydrolase [Candidatus Magasanikbacteria bacterium]